MSLAERSARSRSDNPKTREVADAPRIFTMEREVDRADDGWSDSDDELDLSGEYTGKYKMVVVPTKADPPTIEERERAECWGRPVSPFPYREIMERSLPSSDLSEEDVLCPDTLETAETVNGPSVKTLPTEPPESPLSVTPTRPNGVGGSSEDSVEVEIDTDLVKISSDDPQTAIRAAAVLIRHNYDCVSPSPEKREASTWKRRKAPESTNITESYGELKPRRHTIHDFGTSLLSGYHKRTREWTRKDWKHLDECLLAERLAVGISSDRSDELLAPVNAVSKDVVLKQFIAEVGGDDVLDNIGSEWSRENLMLRLEILVKRHQGLSSVRAWPRCRAKGGAPGLDTTPGHADDPRPPRVGTEEPRTRKSKLVMLQGRAIYPEPRPVHPRDRVHLRHTAVAKESKIPVPVKPRRLVDLKHWSPNKTAGQAAGALRRRRSSGSSVKDLVQSYEGMGEGSS